MKRYKTVEGMFTSAFKDEVDDNGNPIVPTEEPINEDEYNNYRYDRIREKMRAATH